MKNQSNDVTVYYDDWVPSLVLSFQKHHTKEKEGPTDPMILKRAQTGQKTCQKGIKAQKGQRHKHNIAIGFSHKTVKALILEMVEMIKMKELEVTEP